MEEDKLTQEEQSLFDSLSRETVPPQHLQDKIIKELKEKKLIKENVMKSSKTKLWTIGIAASLLLFFCGYLLGSVSSGSSEISSGYMLLLHEDENFQPVGTEMEIFTEYATWMGKMMLSGINITGKELAPETTSWVNAANGHQAKDFEEDKVSGYFIIDVDDRGEAQKIAASSPHIKFGGTVELIKLSERN